MTEAVVHRASLRIREHLIRRVDLFEANGRAFVARVFVGMVNGRELAK